MICGKALMDETAEYCSDCERTSHLFIRGFSVWENDPAILSAIYRLKYHNKRSYADYFAGKMAEHFRRRILRWKIGLIVSVPIGTAKRKERGYNHTDLIAKSLGKRLSIPADTRHLKRVRDTAAQKDMDVTERRRNLMTAFTWKGKEQISGSVLVVDDIYTTGSTLDGVAKALKEAGADSVYFLTISIGQGY